MTLGNLSASDRRETRRLSFIGAPRGSGSRKTGQDQQGDEFMAVSFAGWDARGRETVEDATGGREREKLGRSRRERGCWRIWGEVCDSRRSEAGGWWRKGGGSKLFGTGCPVK